LAQPFKDMMDNTPSTKRGGASGLLNHGAALACALALGAGTRARAQELSGVPGAAASVVPFKWGVMLDVGAPDGIGASGVVKPLSWLRLNAGMMTNTVSFGVRGGASLLVLNSFVAPTLNADVGHYFGGDYNKLVERLGGSPGSGTALARDVSYEYATGSLGLEVGPHDSWAVLLHVGLSYWSIHGQNTQQFLQDSTNDSSITATPLNVRLTSPSLKLGFLYYF
jgi:hypothetical protein